MTHQDDAMTTLQPRIHQRAESCTASLMPVEQLVALAGRITDPLPPGPQMLLVPQVLS